MFSDFVVSTQDNNIIIKYADNTTILGLIERGDESGYRALVENTIVDGEENDLIHYKDKTREIIMDFRKKRPPLQPHFIKWTEVERANSHIFLRL